MPANLRNFDLPERYRPTPDDPLQEFLKKNKAMPVTVNVAALRRLDTLAVQLLLVAAADWRRRGIAFSLTGLRPDIVEALDQIGVTPDLLDRGVSA